MGYTGNIPAFRGGKKNAYNRLRFLTLFRSLTIVSLNTSEYICVVLTDVWPNTFCTVVMATP